MLSSKFTQIIDKTATNKKLDTDILSSISNFLFSELKKEMGEYRNLSIQIEGLGIWFYRRNKLNLKKKQLEDLIEGKVKENKKPYEIKQLTKEQAEEKLIKVNRLIELYPLYIAEKKEIRDNNKNSTNESLF